MNNIARNLKDLLEGNYKYAKNSRIEEFKEYDDFKERFVITSNAEDFLEAFYEVYKHIDERRLPGFFWLASSYNIHLYKLLPRLLSEGVAKGKKKRYLESCIKKLDIWPESTFALYTKRDKKDILSHASIYGIDLTDQAINILI